MQFYNLKTRLMVEVSDSNIVKRKLTRKSEVNGVEVTRYMLVGTTDEGHKVTKLISAKTYESSHYRAD